MEKARYMISDAARMVALEQHVLRYWEDELQLDIPAMRWGIVTIQMRISRKFFVSKTCGKRAINSKPSACI